MLLQTSQRGFTLSELIVVVALISLFTIMVLLGAQDDQKEVELTNIGHEAALLVRSAQTMGSNGRLHEGDVVPYGVRISPQSREMELYIDMDTSLNHTSVDIEFDSFIPANKNVTVSSFCVEKQRGGDCISYEGVNDRLDIVYKRPDIRPYISVFQIQPDGTEDKAGSRYYRAMVILRHGSGVESSVIIESTGSIYVED